MTEQRLFRLNAVKLDDRVAFDFHWIGTDVTTRRTD